MRTRIYTKTSFGVQSKSDLEHNEHRISLKLEPKGLSSVSNIIVNMVLL